MAGGMIAAGAVLGGLGVALGAFGAHGLAHRLAPDQMEIYRTAVQYHFYHAVALVLLGLFVGGRGSSALAYAAGGAFFLGVLLFSGSLYLMVLTGTRWLGAVTPIGGVGFLVGWALFAWAALR